MSLILDALNRSRSDAEHVPGLATAHVPGERGAGTLRTWLLSGALVVALALIVWLLWERGSRDATTPVAVSQQAVAPAPVAVEPTATGAASPRPAAVAPVPGAIRVHGGIHTLPYPLESALRVAATLGFMRSPRLLGGLFRR